MPFCGNCGQEISDKANFCGACGRPTKEAVSSQLAGDNIAEEVQLPAEALPVPRFKGPPVECAWCGGKLKRGSSHPPSSGVGVISSLLVVIIGLLLTPFLVGIPIVILGLLVLFASLFLSPLGRTFQTELFWQCVRCGRKVPRRPLHEFAEAFKRGYRGAPS